MFEGLTERLGGVFSGLRKKGALTEDDVKQSLRQIRLVLLEADVNFRVVKSFLSNIKQRAVGEEVMKSLSPGQQMIKIVNEELITLLEGDEKPEPFRPTGAHPIILMAGLNGSGKTTHSAKLALHYKRRGYKPLLVAADVHRPAAIQQLQTMGEKVDVPVFQMGDTLAPVDIAKAALSHADKEGLDLVIVDTAGRLAIDAALMDELATLKTGIAPQQTLLVLDSMTGQDAVNVAEQFDEAVGIDGFILSKMDSDTRGGAALSIRAVTGKPIRYLGVGEKPDDLEEFHADRLAQRILGMGDVLSLIEKAEQNLDQDTQRDLEEKLRNNEFDLEDFRTQLRQVTKMGPLQNVLGMIPGMGQALAKGNMDIDDSAIGRLDAIIGSMTPEERRNPDIIRNSRRKRIAKGSGTTTRAVNQLLKQFKQMKSMFGQFNKLEKSKKGRRALSRMFGR